MYRYRGFYAHNVISIRRNEILTYAFDTRMPNMFAQWYHTCARRILDYAWAWRCKSIFFQLSLTRIVVNFTLSSWLSFILHLHAGYSFYMRDYNRLPRVSSNRSLLGSRLLSSRGRTHVNIRYVGMQRECKTQCGKRRQRFSGKRDPECIAR